MEMIIKRPVLFQILLFISMIIFFISVNKFEILDIMNCYENAYNWAFYAYSILIVNILINIKWN